MDGQGPGLHLLHPLHRVAHGGSFSWTSSGNRKRRRLRSGEYRKEAAAAVGTRRTWAFRGGPGPSLIWKVGADLPEPRNVIAKVPSARRGSRAAPRARLDSPRTHTTHATQTGIRWIRIEPGAIPLSDVWCVWCVCGVCLAVLVVWCLSSAGPPKSKVATSLAYTKNRLNPNLPSINAHGKKN